MNKGFLLISVVFIFAVPALAQVWTPAPPPPTDMSKIWHNYRIGQIGNQMAADMARQSQAGKPGPGAAKKAPVKDYSNVYRKDFAFVRADNSVLAQKLAKGQAGDKTANLKQMNELMNGLWTGYQRAFADENERLKMPYNDVATAMTYYIEMNYMRVHDIPVLESEKSVAVYRQIADIFAKDAPFSKLAPAEKQLMAEVLLLMGEMPMITFNRNRNFAEMKKLSGENLTRIFGDNAAKLKITDDGLEF